jgi:formylglycine-generating enzyme required for sulfatase activity
MRWRRAGHAGGSFAAFLAGARSASARARMHLCAAVPLLLSGACSRAPEGGASTADGAPAGTASAFVWPLETADAREPAPPPRRGMVWIPEGTFLAGTPKDRIPRIADAELPGEAITLHGFYVDEFAYPNEVAAIPKTGVTHDEAASLCASQSKRLCTELEWERACKGPASTTYEYGDAYRASECAMGAASRLSPSGLLVGCKSVFGVHDMHGGPWEWTDSPYNRATVGLLATRGGNGETGEITGRCANGEARPPQNRRPDLGLRCCAGEPNTTQVTLAVTRGKQLDARPPDRETAEAMEHALMSRLPKELPPELPFHIDRTWLWHPVGNEELVLAAGCSRLPAHLACGVGVFRPGALGPLLLSFASSGWWMAVVRHDYNGRDAWVYGGDERSSFRRHVSYLWGRVAVGEPERKLEGVVP